MNKNFQDNRLCFRGIDPRIAFAAADCWSMNISNVSLLHYSFLVELTTRYHSALQSIAYFSLPLFSCEAIFDDESPHCVHPLFAFDIEVSLRQLIRGNMIRSLLPDLWNELEKEKEETQIRLSDESRVSY